MIGRSRPPVTRCFLAGWQRLLLWTVWIGLLLVVWNVSRLRSAGWTEAGLFAAAVLVTIACLQYRFGPPKVIISEPAEMTGEFEARASYVWLAISALATIVGIIVTAKLARDLDDGSVTISGVFVDVVDFFTDWLLELVTKGRRSDVGTTHLYILVGLLPIGLAMLWYHLLPVWHRGSSFRISRDGSVLIKRGNDWVSLPMSDFACASANGFTVDFQRTPGSRPAVALPQWRVYSREHATPVGQHVVASFFRQRLEALGFQVQTLEPGRRLETKWIATRTGQ